jgi:netrin receptor unc-5
MAYLATKSSPTDHILTLWEARHRDVEGNSDLQSAVGELMNSLRAIGRTDAVSIIDKYVQTPWL